MSWWCRLAAVFLIVGIVLPPLRASAATVPMLLAYDVAVRPTATVRVETVPEPRPERGSAPEYVYDGALDGYDDASKPPVVGGAGAENPYGRALELAERRELGEGLTYDVPNATTAAEGLAGPEASIIGRSFRPANPIRPPNAAATQRMSGMQTCWSTDCSEIAEWLLDSAGTGRILRAAISAWNAARA